MSLIWTQWKKSKIIDCLKSFQIYNKIENNHYLTNKYNLLRTMKEYYKRSLAIDYKQHMPLTFGIKIDYETENLAENKRF